MTRASDESDQSKPIVLIVDDTPQNLMVLAELLQSSYHVRAVNNGERALRAAAILPQPDLILLDIMMPDMNGYDVITALKADPLTADIPVIFITAMTEKEDEERGFEYGGVDYITKPFAASTVLARTKTHVELKLARDRLKQENTWLDQEVARRMRENHLVQDLTIRALACLAEARDNETGLHVVRTQAYIEILANALEHHPRFENVLDDGRKEMIIKAAPLHDIGKVGIPDSILLKPGKLTEEEFEIIKTHPLIGSEVFNRAMEQVMASADDLSIDEVPGAFAFLHVADEICLHHHERWDGSGYPDGLKGDNIPVAARLMALADVFDAITCRRIYKDPIPIEEATEVIVAGKGTHFDPEIVSAYLAELDRFKDIRERFAETGEDLDAVPMRP